MVERDLGDDSVVLTVEKEISYRYGTYVLVKYKIQIHFYFTFIHFTPPRHVAA